MPHAAVDASVRPSFIINSSVHFQAVTGCSLLRLCVQIYLVMPDDQESSDHDESHTPPATSLTLDPEQTRATPRKHRHSFNYDDERLNQSPPPSPVGIGVSYAAGEETPLWDNSDSTHGILGDAVSESLRPKLTKMSTTRWLAQKHGVRNPTKMYVNRGLSFTGSELAGINYVGFV